MEKKYSFGTKATEKVGGHCCTLLTDLQNWQPRDFKNKRTGSVRKHRLDHEIKMLPLISRGSET